MVVAVSELLSEDEFEAPGADVFDFPLDGFDAGEGSSPNLWGDDQGRMSLIERKALVALLKTPYISAGTHGPEWRAVCADPDLFRSRLNDLFLELVIDLNYEVAFKRQATSESGVREFPTLLHDRAYNREETILLVSLRHRLQSEAAAGHEVVTVDRGDLVELVAGYRPSSATDRAGGVAAAEKAIENLVKRRVLLRTNDSDRLRIAPVLPVLLPLTRLKDLLEWLQGQNGSVTDEVGNDD